MCINDDIKTPRTDFEEYKIWDAGDAGSNDPDIVVDSDFARDLERENNIMRKALKFYADPENWEDVDTGIGMMSGDAVDCGVCAARALEKISQKK